MDDFGNVMKLDDVVNREVSYSWEDIIYVINDLVMDNFNMELAVLFLFY